MHGSPEAQATWGFIELHGIERWTVFAIGFVYLMGVQGITIGVIFP